jgi:hypothetical protein
LDQTEDILGILYVGYRRDFYESIATASMDVTVNLGRPKPEEFTAW